jgi:hypothetical protein
MIQVWYRIVPDDVRQGPQELPGNTCGTEKALQVLDEAVSRSPEGCDQGIGANAAGAVVVGGG